MRIEEHYGEKIVCDHIYKHDEIKVGQRWQGSSGNVVTVEKVKSILEHDEDGEVIDHVIHYYWYDSMGKKVTHNKLAFAFQCRYCLIIDEKE